MQFAIAASLLFLLCSVLVEFFEARPALVAHAHATCQCQGARCTASCPANVAGKAHSKKRVRVEAITAEARQLRRQAKPLNTPSTFAQCAKLQRAAAAKEKDAASVFREASKGPAAAACKAASALRDLLSVTILLKSFWSPVVVLPGPGAGAGFDALLGLGSGYNKTDAAHDGAGGGALVVGTFAYLWVLNRAAGPVGRLASAGVEALLGSRVGCASAIAMEEAD